jgi:hypothetical protein
MPMGHMTYSLPPLLATRVVVTARFVLPFVA